MVLEALGKLVPTLTNVLWVGLLFYYIFAVSAAEQIVLACPQRIRCAPIRQI